MVFSNAKSGISAKTIQRDLEVTYKCAWRMLTLIRKSLKQSEEVLRGDVEMDAGYFGGKGNAGRDNRDLSKVMKKKSVVFAAIQRGGEMRAQVVPDDSQTTKLPMAERGNGWNAPYDRQNQYIQYSPRIR